MASIGPNEDVVSNKEKLDWPPSSSAAAAPADCICRVPMKFREFNEHAYTPEMISIGPFHRDKAHLQAMEEHKLRYVDELLSRLENRVAKLEECIEAISILEVEIRKCYSEPIILDKESFVKMMIVDGLFIIELFRKNAREEYMRKDDPIFKNVWGLSSLVRDMILLENQLPMLVLECLFNIAMAQQGGKKLSELAIRFFNPLMPREESVLAKYFSIRGKHLLDLLWKTFHDFPPGIRSESVLARYFDSFIPMKLTDSGYKFKKRSNACSFLNMGYNNGVAEIPPILIQDQTFSFLRNIIAYEQCCGGPLFFVTTYVSCMKDFANSSNDVAILRKHGIIRNYLSDDGLVSSLFHNLGSEINHVNFSLCSYHLVNNFPKTIAQETIYRMLLLLIGIVNTSAAFSSLHPIFRPYNYESTLQSYHFNTLPILEAFCRAALGVVVIAISFKI